MWASLGRGVLLCLRETEARSWCPDGSNTRLLEPAMLYLAQALRGDPMCTCVARKGLFSPHVQVSEGNTRNHVQAHMSGKTDSLRLSG